MEEKEKKNLINIYRGISGLDHDVSELRSKRNFSYLSFLSSLEHFPTCWRGA